MYISIASRLGRSLSQFVICYVKFGNTIPKFSFFHNSNYYLIAFVLRFLSFLQSVKEGSMAGAKEGVLFARNGIENAGFAYAFSLIEGKYKLPVLFCLYLDGTTRYNELKRKLAPATYKSLTSALRGLVADGLVKRVEYPQVPPKVEYSLTERGLSLMPVLDELCLWGEAHRDDRVPSSDW